MKAVVSVAARRCAFLSIDYYIQSITARQITCVILLILFATKMFELKHLKFVTSYDDVINMQSKCHYTQHILLVLSFSLVY